MASKLQQEKEYESDDGACIVYYDKDSPILCRHLEYCKSMVDLVIDSYNHEHSKKYRMVELMELYAIPGCGGGYLSMNFTAKLDDGTNDAVIFEAHTYGGIKGTIIEAVRIVELSMKEQYQLQIQQGVST